MKKGSSGVNVSKLSGNIIRSDPTHFLNIVFKPRGLNAISLETKCNFVLENMLWEFLYYDFY